MSPRGGFVENIRHGFVGCLQRLRVDLAELPLHGSSSVGVLRDVHDIDFHCDGVYIPGLLFHLGLALVKCF